EYQLIQFLEEKLAISQSAIATALNHHNADISLLPITLWKYHLITLNEVSELFDWLANSQFIQSEGSDTLSKKGVSHGKI
ncbi:MAG: DUF2949 domain-containing protein, partial [Cyanobacteria bacterium J06554_11]